MECAAVRAAIWPKGDVKSVCSRFGRNPCRLSTDGVASLYSYSKMTATHIPTRMRARSSPYADARAANVVVNERVETVYRTVVGVGRLTESIVGLWKCLMHLLVRRICIHGSDKVRSRICEAPSVASRGCTGTSHFIAHAFTLLHLHDIICISRPPVPWLGAYFHDLLKNTLLTPDYNCTESAVAPRRRAASRSHGHTGGLNQLALQLPVRKNDIEDIEYTRWLHHHYTVTRHPQVTGHGTFRLSFHTSLRAPHAETGSSKASDQSPHFGASRSRV